MESTWRDAELPAPIDRGRLLTTSQISFCLMHSTHLYWCGDLGFQVYSTESTGDNNDATCLVHHTSLKQPTDLSAMS
jgi:hypothetical protein